MSESLPKRGRVHDAEGARQAILNAAEEVFAEHGFDGARIDAIAAKAGYNKSLIFQYYGDKLNLYAEVIRRADWTASELQTQILDYFSDDRNLLDTQSIRRFMGEFFNSLFDYFQKYPRITRIFLWEMAEGWQTFSKIVSQRELEDVAVFAPLVAKIQSSGLTRPDFDPMAQVLMVEFMYMYFWAMIPLFQIFLPGQDFSSPAAIEKAKKFILGFVYHGLTVEAE